MTTWIETTNVKQDGTPVTRKIKIPEMAEEIWFTDNAYAEVADDVADILANNIDAISKTTEPSSPGSYYGDAGSNTTVELVVADGAYDNLTVETLDSDLVSTGELYNADNLATTRVHLDPDDSSQIVVKDRDDKIGTYD